MYSYGPPPHMPKQKQDDQLEHTYSSYMRIRDVTLKTSQKRWMIGRSGEWGSGISVLAARHDDDNDIYDAWIIYSFIYLFKIIDDWMEMNLTKIYVYIFSFTCHSCELSKNKQAKMIFFFFYFSSKFCTVIE